MRTWLQNAWSICDSNILKSSSKLGAFSITALVSATGALAAQSPSEAGGEANLKLPDLSSVNFVFGLNGHKLLLFGILFCLFGLGFGLTIYSRLKNLPVHQAMRDISELI